jgi:CHAD domain-containing protein
VCGKRATRLAKAIAKLQGVLGDLHDAAVAEGWLRRTASRASAGQALAAGLLVAIEREERRARRSEWYDAWQGAVDERRRWRS